MENFVLAIFIINKVLLRYNVGAGFQVQQAL
jgi:hypothetical protein